MLESHVFKTHVYTNLKNYIVCKLFHDKWHRYDFFIIQTNKCTTNILEIFYILYILLHVAMHLEHLQGVLSFYVAQITT